jgi:hypothetical protein
VATSENVTGVRDQPAGTPEIPVAGGPAETVNVATFGVSLVPATSTDQNVTRCDPAALTGIGDV